MTCYRIKISSWTSSFRYPNIISGYQPTLLVPPLSTVLGLINACAGKYLDFNDIVMGYYFEFGAESTDLETIYQIEINNDGVPKDTVKRNVINRSFLFDNKLYLYLYNKELVDFFRNPIHQVLLGRSGDLATIEEIVECELEEINNAQKIKGQIIPFHPFHLPGTIQALPQYFTNTIPRRNLGTKAYSVISYDVQDFATDITAYRDTIGDKTVDIFMHRIQYES